METESYKKAGKIAGQALQHGAGFIKEGAKVLDIANAVENKVIALGGRLAFPVNISINEMSAHCTPLIGDTLTIKADDYVKLDVGAHVNGYIGDTAMTVRPLGKDDLIICSEKMLENALKVMKPGTTIEEIGEIIEETAKKFGFNPVRNLTGHSLNQYDLHAGMTIPNIRTSSRYQIREGEIYAIEPFCTAGAGQVKDSGNAEIFRWLNDRPIRIPEGRVVLELARNDFSRLPFAKRWITGITKIKLDMILRQLIQANAIHPYFPLKEVTNKPVAQSEHTVIVSEKPIITTKL
ncbi:MAG: type II methionyl aminopeptidase [Nanoarchaeota archaeon]|nr:type II methionyl aminopeptidase [Nanoarchaeota archaeon]MBU4124347.1 type II methionyl aminopeptidase [Nanoarchaeota archaeon]